VSSEQNRNFLGVCARSSSYAKPAFQPLQYLLETGLQHYAVLGSAPGRMAWPPINELELASDLLRNTGFVVIDVRGEQHGYYLANPEKWWAILCPSAARWRWEQLAADALARFKTEHLARRSWRWRRRTAFS